MKATFAGGKYDGKVFDVDELTHLPEFEGKFTKDYSYERAQGELVPNKDLDHRPILNYYNRPMLDDGMLRYVSTAYFAMFHPSV